MSEPTNLRLERALRRAAERGHRMGEVEAHSAGPMHWHQSFCESCGALLLVMQDRTTEGATGSAYTGPCGPVAPRRSGPPGAEREVLEKMNDILRRTLP